MTKKSSAQRDWLSEKFFLLSAGPKMVGKSQSSLRDMIKRGRLSINGETVKLESFKLEGGTATSVEALAEFRQRLNF